MLRPSNQQWLSITRTARLLGVTTPALRARIRHKLIVNMPDPLSSMVLVNLESARDCLAKYPVGTAGHRIVTSNRPVRSVRCRRRGGWPCLLPPDRRRALAARLLDPPDPPDCWWSIRTIQDWLERTWSLDVDPKSVYRWLEKYPEFGPPWSLVWASRQSQWQERWAEDHGLDTSILPPPKGTKRLDD